ILARNKARCREGTGRAGRLLRRRPSGTPSRLLLVLGLVECRDILNREGPICPQMTRPDCSLNTSDHCLILAPQMTIPTAISAQQLPTPFFSRGGTTKRSGNRKPARILRIGPTLKP